MRPKMFVVVLLCMVPSVLFGSYPELVQPVALSLDFQLAEPKSLQPFLDQWGTDEYPSLQALFEKLPSLVEQNDYGYQQLATVVEQQKAQLGYLQESSKARFGYTATPYSYNDTVSNGKIVNSSHTFGIGGTYSQTLPSMGTVSVTVKENASYSTTFDSWTHTPSVSVSLQQPLWIGKGMFNTGYQENQEKKQGYAVAGTEASRDALRQAMILQQLRLLVLRQTLLENRFLLNLRAKLAYDALTRATLDLEQGLVSRQSYETAQLSYYQIATSIQSLELEMEDVERSLREIWKDSLPQAISLSCFDPFALIEKTLLGDDLLNRYLAVDPEYQQALASLRSAMLDTFLYSQSDAPQLQLSLQAYPLYSPATGTSFFNSFSDLFSDSEPVLSFSVGFSASDVFRRSSDLQQQRSEQVVLGAMAKVEQVTQAAKQELATLHGQVKQACMNLLLNLSDYELKQVQLETEQIRNAAALGDATTLQKRELDWYQAAFTVLQALRELEFLSVQLQLLWN